MTDQGKLILDIHKEFAPFYEYNAYDVCIDVGTVICIKNSFFIRKLKCVEGSCKKCFFYKNFGKVCNLLNCSGKCFEEIECKLLKPVPTVKFELKLENTKKVF